MPAIKIECPQCHGRFTLKAPNLQAMASKSFSCPKCGFSAPFGQLMSAAGIPVQPARPVPPPAPMHTHISGGGMPQPVGGKTSIASGNNLATLTVVDSGRKFNLSQGDYTLGRESSDSRASLRIAPDHYMSRLQAQLKVARGADGKPDCVITGVAATNPIFVNNVCLNPGQATRLKNGDVVLLGVTKVVVNF